MKLDWLGICPVCKGENVYCRRTSPVATLGCRDCDREVKRLEEKGFTEKQIIKLLGLEGWAWSKQDD